jgi:hypothetical protein
MFSSLQLSMPSTNYNTYFAKVLEENNDLQRRLRNALEEIEAWKAVRLLYLLFFLSLFRFSYLCHSSVCRNALKRNVVSRPQSERTSN